MRKFFISPSGVVGSELSGVLQMEDMQGVQEPALDHRETTLSRQNDMIQVRRTKRVTQLLTHVGFAEFEGAEEGSEQTDH